MRIQFRWWARDGETEYRAIRRGNPNYLRVPVAGDHVVVHSDRMEVRFVTLQPDGDVELVVRFRSGSTWDTAQYLAEQGWEVRELLAE